MLHNFQKAGSQIAKRTDHVWTRKAGRYICVLCGANALYPPDFPTPSDWEADRYDKLTDAERSLSPMLAGKVGR